MDQATKPSTAGTGGLAHEPLLIDVPCPTQMGLECESLARESGLGALPQTQACVASSDIAICDWNELFNAVKIRLKAVVSGSPDTALASVPGDGHQIRAAVEDCIAGLDQLHRTLAHELGRCQQLELEAFDARTALLHTRAELAGTREGERRALHLSRHDSLTSLPNRHAFLEHLNQVLELPSPQRQSLALMYLDLDGFKRINDVHGHAAGDELLRIVAARLLRAVRAEDMVSRLGGDEFACLLSGLDERAQLVHLADKVFETVSAPCKIGTQQIVIRPSIGIALCPADGWTSSVLLHNADRAMYSAKRRHSRHAFFDGTVAFSTSPSRSGLELGWPHAPAANDRILS